MKAFNANMLFSKRPQSATIGLALAAFSFAATFLSGLLALTSSRKYVLFDSTIITFSESLNLPRRVGIVAMLWGMLGLFAVLRAHSPRPYARMAIVGLIGIKLLYVFQIHSSAGAVQVVENIAILIYAAAPIILLLTRSSSRYYSDE